MKTTHIKKGVWNFKKIDRKHFKAKFADIDVCVFVCVWRLNIELYITRNTEFSSAVSSGKERKKTHTHFSIESNFDVMLSYFACDSFKSQAIHMFATQKRAEEKKRNGKKAREWDNNNDGNRVAVSTIDRNQKISSGQFNSNLNPIKDLVTNPQQHTFNNNMNARTFVHTFGSGKSKTARLFNTLCSLFFSARLWLSISSSISHSLFAPFRVIILLQGIKIRQRSSNVMDFWELDSFVCLKNTSDCVYASVNIVKAKTITTKQRRARMRKRERERESRQISIL